MTLFKRLLSYLRHETRASGGTLYCKSKQVAADLDVSPREVGIRLSHCSTCDDIPLDVSKWAGENNAATWVVTIDDNGSLIDYTARMDSEPNLNADGARS